MASAVTKGLLATGLHARTALWRANGLKALMFDMAGTTVDFGSVAPVLAFVEVFKRQGIEITAEDARKPMGLNKRDHIIAVLRDSSITTQWQKKKQRSWNEMDVDTMYHNFLPVQLELAAQRTKLIRGMPEVLEFAKERKLKIGAGSGYNRPIMEAVLKGAAHEGFLPDAWTCGDDKGLNGRPKPWMSLDLARKLDVYPIASCVKIDDTVPGILEGLNAGMWTVAVALSGNELGWTEEEILRAKPDAFKAKLESARAKLAGAGAHFVIDGVWELPKLLDELDTKIRTEGATPFDRS